MEMVNLGGLPNGGAQAGPPPGEDNQHVALVALETAALVDQGVTEAIQTVYGPITVTISGDRSKTALVTVHDIGLNHISCFQGLLMCAGPESNLVKNFCMYHISLPGHEAVLGHMGIQEDSPGIYQELLPITADKLADMVAAVIQHYGLREVMGMGVGYGAHVLLKYALSAKHTDLGALILMTPLTKKAGWMEWGNCKAAAASLWYGGLTGWTTEYVISRLLHHGMMHGNGDIAKAFRRELVRRKPSVLAHFLTAAQRRDSLLPKAAALKARVLLMAGSKSPFFQECLDLNEEISKVASFVEVTGAGTLVAEERPHELTQSIDLFLQRMQSFGFGL